MIPVRQTIFAGETSKVDNCMSACIASILERTLDNVIDTASEEMREKGFWIPIYDWLEEQGYDCFWYTLPKDFDKLNGIYTIGCGSSPRGAFHHAIVCKNGIMVFDPHPSDDGLLEIQRHFVITKSGISR